MRGVAILLIAFSTLAFSKDRAWKDAVFLGMTSDAVGAAAMPIGNVIVAVPLSGRTYWFKCKGMTYAAAFDPAMQWHAPNLTVNAHVKIAIDGHNIRVVDDDNKDRKLKIVGKFAPKDEQQ